MWCVGGADHGLVLPLATALDYKEHERLSYREPESEQQVRVLLDKREPIDVAARAGRKRALVN